jgi:hypothetical protein
VSRCVALCCMFVVFFCYDWFRSGFGVRMTPPPFTSLSRLFSAPGLRCAVRSWFNGDAAGLAALSPQPPPTSF